jgi:hypothetical protein
MAEEVRSDNNLLRKRMPAGVDTIVPEPHLRANLIQTTHLDTGHFEIKKTYSLLEPVYIWAGMYEQVRFEVRACAACDRVNFQFRGARHGAETSSSHHGCDDCARLSLAGTLDS